MNTWLYLVATLLIVGIVLCALPISVLSDNYSWDSNRGDLFFFETEATVDFSSTEFFAVELEDVLLAANKTEAGYLLELSVEVGESLNVVKGSPEISISPSDSNNYFELMLFRSFWDYVGDVILMSILAIVIWFIGTLVIIEVMGY